MTAAETLPAPLVPADVDLREFPYTPMFRARLFGSSFHAKATDGEWRAGVTLWLKSWDQVPAGTLPDDDVDLCRLAELGRDLKTWKKLKTRALHGWVKCDDGRLHHAVVAEGVLEAWGKRSNNSKKGKAGAAKRWGTGNASATKSDSPAISPANAKGNASAIARPMAGAMPGDSKGIEREGKEEPSVGSLPFKNGPAIERVTSTAGRDRFNAIKAEAAQAIAADPILAEAREILGAYCRAVREVWDLPTDPIPRDGPKGDIETAKAWARDGITASACLDVLGPVLKAKRDRDGEVPGTLSYLDGPVRRAHAAKGAPTLAGQAPPNPMRERRAQLYLAKCEQWKRDSAHGNPGYPEPMHARYMAGDHDDELLEIPAFLQRKATA